MLLAGLLGKADDPSAMRQVTDLLGDRAVDSSILSNVGSLLSATQPGSTLGALVNRFLAFLFGDRTGQITRGLADYAGISETSASSLLRLATPLVIGVLADRVRRDGLTPTGLGGLLGQQRDSILAALPGALAGILGQRTRRTAEAAIPHASSQRSGSWWVAPVLGLLVLGGLWALLRGQTSEVPEGQRLMTMTKQAAPASEVMKRLPSGAELRVPSNSLESELIAFIQDNRPLEPPIWIDFDRLLFDTGRATLRPESGAQLRNVSEILKAYPSVQVKIGGYTDNVGDPAANLKLSKDRAANVRTELVQLGIAPGRMTAEGYGEEHPVADNSTEEGRAQNRRIGVRVTQR
jgi:outer membrane protein OmpA-like peptidoglycan-associated protein